MLLEFLNIFFFVFHTSILLFNCFGWCWKKTRRLNLLMLLLTAGSWFLLGIWFGWGYCLCTDWHWQVREGLGLYDQSASYVHFLILKLTGIRFPPALVDKLTVSLFFFSLAISSWLNFRDYKNTRLIKRTKR